MSNPEIVYPDWKLIAENILKYESWGPEPLETRLARELEDAYKRGAARERMRQYDERYEHQ